MRTWLQEQALRNYQGEEPGPLNLLRGTPYASLQARIPCQFYHPGQTCTGGCCRAGNGGGGVFGHLNWVSVLFAGGQQGGLRGAALHRRMLRGWGPEQGGAKRSMGTGSPTHPREGCKHALSCRRPRSDECVHVCMLPLSLLPPEHAVCGIPSSYMRSLGVYGPMYLVTALLVHR